jgi:hypothetical protein
MVCDMAKTLETKEESEAAQILRELEALPPGYKLTFEELMSYVRRMPKPKPGSPTAAEAIRELRGPLPGDDDAE